MVWLKMSGKTTRALVILCFTECTLGFNGLLSPYKSKALGRAQYSVRPSSFAPTMTKSAAEQNRPISKLRLIQHKKEAFVFYRFLSIVYDHIVNPGHWTEDMREEALQPAKLDSPDLDTVDVGGGTGFCSIGILKAGIMPEKLTIMDQSPHQLEKARQKPELQGVKIIEGDAEDLPFETDSKDRYVSAGSIEYWPEPQRGIAEAYRVLRPGGVACMIGPVYPTFPISKFFADLWMLFPREDEYLEWFRKAGFEDVSIKRIGPWWYHGVRRHGLIMGCSGVSSLPLPFRHGNVLLTIRVDIPSAASHNKFICVGCAPKYAEGPGAA